MARSNVVKDFTDIEKLLIIETIKEYSLFNTIREMITPPDGFILDHLMTSFIYQY